MEKLSFNKYAKTCELEACHGVNIESTYVNEVARKTFCLYMAETKREELLSCLAQAQGFSFLMDGSTDVADVEGVSSELLDDQLMTHTDL